jgi:uncharacterized oxidoreductase
MKITDNTILITGGATGIGLALTEAFSLEHNRVIICGRRKESLSFAQDKFPNIQIKVCNVAITRERQSLFEWGTANFPDLNILVNNARI